MATKIADAYVEIRTNQAKFSKELKTMEGTVKSSTDRMKKNFDRIGKGVSELSKSARLGFLAMSAAIAGTVYAAAKYEKEMANVSTMLSRKSMPIMKKYKDLVGKMGIIFGESTETLSKGLYDILSASIRPEKALKVLAVSAKAAAAGLTDTGVAADAITTIINSYGYSAEDASMISDKLFTIIARGKTTFAELGPNIGKVSTLAAQAGLDFDELGASIATMTRAGIRTEMTMTAISGILRVFIKPTTEAKEAAKEFGLELDSNTLKTLGLVGVLEKLNGATAEQLALIFPEIEGLKGLAAQIGDLTGYTEDYKAMLESAGATQEAYLKQTNTLTFTFNQLKEAGKYLAVQIGEIFTPIVSQAIKKITDLAIKLGQAIKGLTSDQKNSVAQMVLFGTAVLGAIGSLSLFAVAAKLVMAAGLVIVGVLGFIASPLGLVMLAVGALALIWVKNWGDIQGKVEKVWEVLKPILDEIGKWCKIVWDWTLNLLGKAWDWLEKTWPKIEEGAVKFWEWLKGLANITWDWIVKISGTVWDFLKDTWPVIKEGAIAFWEWLKNLADKSWDWLVNIAGNIWDFFKDTWPIIKEGTIKFWEWIKNLTDKTISLVVNLGGIIWDWLKDTWPKISDTATKFWDWLKSLTAKTIDWSIEIAGKVWDWLRDVWPKISEKAKAFWEWISSLTKKAIDWTIEIGGKVWDWLKDTWPKIKENAIAFWNWIKDLANKTWDWVAGISGSAWDWLKEIWPNIKENAVAFWEWVKNLSNKIYEWSINILGKAWDWLRDVWPKISEKAKEFWTWLNGLANKSFDWVINVLGTAWDWLKDVWPNISDAAKKFWDWLKGLASKAWDWVINIAGKFWDWLVDIWPTISESAKKFWEWIKGLASKAMDWSIEIIGEGWKWIEEKWPDLKDTLIAFVNWLKGLPADIKKVYELIIKIVTEPGEPEKEGMNWAEKFWETFKISVEGVIETIKLKLEIEWDFLTIIGSFFKGLWKALTKKSETEKVPAEISTTIGDKILAGIRGVIIEGFLIVKWIRDVVEENIEEWKSIGEYIGEKIGEGVKTLFLLPTKIWRRDVTGAKEDITTELKEVGKIEIDWSGLWGEKASAQTREAIDNISGLRETVEKEIGTKIPEEFDELIVALVASESKFNAVIPSITGEFIGLGQIGEDALEDVNKALEKSGSKWKFTMEDMIDPVKNLQATIIYFGIVSKRNDYDLMKSITYWKGWGKQIEKSGGELKKMPPEAQKQFKAFLKICKDFGIDAVDLMTLIGKKMVGGSGGIIGELEKGNIEVGNELGKMSNQMGKMVDGMSKIFMPIIDMFKVIFTKVIAVIKKFDEEAGTALEKFVNETLGLIDGMFNGPDGIVSKFGDGAADIVDEWERLGVNIFKLTDSTGKEIKKIIKTFAEIAAETWGDAFEAIGRAAFSTIADIIRGVETMEEAFLNFAKKLQTIVSDALLNLAVAAAQAGDAVSAVLLGLAALIVSVADSIIDWINNLIWGQRELTKLEKQVKRLGDTIAEAFADLAMQLHDTIKGAEKDIASLMEKQANLQKNTREKLISELDKYYDYRDLREMDLTQLLELAAKTRETIEKDGLGAIEKIKESDAEADARRNDEASNALGDIIDLYETEQKLLDQKILLLQIEIALLEYKIYLARAEEGAGKWKEKANDALKRATDLMDKYNDEYGENVEKVKDTRKEQNKLTDATDDATDAVDKYGKEGQRKLEEIKVAIKEAKDEFHRTKEKIDETKQALEQYGERGTTSINNLGLKFREFSEDMKGYIDELNEKDIGIPVSFNIEELNLPAIAGITIPIEWGIPTAQTGIPYVPRTMPIVVHPKEAILTASQAENWRAGRGGAGGNTFNIRILHTGDIRSDMDEEQFMQKVTSRIAETVRRN